MNKIDNFKKVIDICFMVLKQLQHDKIKDKFEIQGRRFLTRMTLIANSISIIYDKNKNMYFDPYSPKILLRSIVEDYITMHYLLIEKVSKYEINFRLRLWERHSLGEQKKMFEKKDWNSSVKYKQIEKDYNELTIKINNSRYFKKLSIDKRNEIIRKNSWESITRKERIKNAGFNISELEFLYIHLSAYTHSYLFSFLAEDKILEKSEIIRKIEAIKFYTYFFLALTLDDLRKLSSITERLLKDDKTINEIIKECQKVKGERSRPIIVKDPNTGEEFISGNNQ